MVGTEAVRTTELSAITLRVRAAESAVTASFADLPDNLELLHLIGGEDERIATSLDRTRTEFQQTRAATEREARDGIVANRDALAVAERNKASALATVRQDRASFVAEADGLAATEMSLSSTTDAHDSSLIAGQGTRVGIGFVIALSGNTGHSTGPHV